jgi:hypothetical protein
MLKGYTEEDLVGLSAAERAILEGDDDNDGEGSENELTALAGDGNEDEGADPGGKDGEDGDGKEGKGKEGGDGEDGDAAAGAKAGDDKGKDGEKPGKTDDKDGKKAAETDDDAGVDTGVTFTPQTPADADKLRDQLNTRKDEAFTKLMDGEIDAAEYKKVEKEVDGELQKLLQANITDNVTATLTQANIAKAWKAEVSTALKAAAADGIDYSKDEAKTKELDRLIRVFGAEATEAGMSDDGLKASKWALGQALETMKRRYSTATPAANGGAKPGKPAAAGSRAGEKPDLGAIPPGLSKAPIAASSDGGGDEFAHLGGLKGAALEKAIAKMTPEQQDRYLS